jgi:hypothetical protein
MCGTVEVLLAVVPAEEFRIHFWLMPGASLKPYGEAIKRRAAARARYGWTGETLKDKYGNETSSDNSNSVEHKYFSLTHSGI